MLGWAASARCVMTSAAVRPWMAQWSLFCTVAKKVWLTGWVGS